MPERSSKDLGAMLDRMAAEASEHQDKVISKARTSIRRSLADSTERLKDQVIYPTESVVVHGQQPDGSPTASGALVLTQYKDAAGNTFFTQTPAGATASTRELQTLRDRIVEQQSAFHTLRPDEQRRITDQYTSSNSPIASAQPYRDHLQSEVVGKRFRQLKPH